MTEWKAVPGFSNYECTQDGRVRSKARYVIRNSGNYNKPDVEIRPTKHGSGYRFFMRGDAGSETVTPQRIIYTTWVGIIPDGYGTILIDNNKPASLDNIELKWIGYRDHDKARVHGNKQSPWKMEGYCDLIGKFLRMRYEC